MRSSPCSKLCVVLACASAATLAAAFPAQATPVSVKVGADYATTPYSFTVDNSTFTFVGTGDPFNPTAVQTAGGAEINTIFGAPTSYFIDRGPVSFGPGMQYSPFSTATTIAYSNSFNFIGLLAVSNGQDYYGYAFTTDSVLNSYAFETTPNTAISASSAVPEPSSWAMLIGGFGLVGGALRSRRKAGVSYA